MFYCQKDRRQFSLRARSKYKKRRTFRVKKRLEIKLHGQNIFIAHQKETLEHWGYV